ncbi:hypothetical protein [Pseudonocardia sp. NPDC049154]|uniref:hypothetical protein n=1 Tax=Pseudonocardia sp. NPDC049154 TaxID=3155501 RepID=UPI0033F90A78
MAVSELTRIPADPHEFHEFAQREGWSDGLPLLPPTEERVATFLAATGADPDEVVAELPPSGAPVTVGRVAANAVMTGAPAGSLPLLVSALRAMSAPAFDLHGLNATTGSVVPALVVNGPQRHALDIAFGAGCLGGAVGGAPSIGRALRLVMRNVAGQVIGQTSQSTFGTPGRVSGIVFGEWEERSPWPALATRRGMPGDAVTAFGAMGTVNICDLTAATPAEMVEFVGKSLPYMGANGFLTGSVFSEVLVAFNPVWAEIIGRRFTDAAELAAALWEYATLPLDWFPEPHRPLIERAGRVRADGRVPLTPEPSDVLVLTAGGMGGLHTAVLHNWGATRSQTVAVGG